MKKCSDVVLHAFSTNNVTGGKFLMNYDSLDTVPSILGTARMNLKGVSKHVATFPIFKTGFLEIVLE